MTKTKNAPIHVLLVEDNPGDARLVEIMLTEMQDGAFRVEKATSFAEAESALGEKTVDAILLDLGLPDSSGLDTASNMIATAPEKAIVVLTGLDDEETGVQAVHRGVQDYLVKGHIDGPLVRRAVRYAIDRHSAFRVLRHQLVFQQQMIDALPIAIFYTDASLAILGCNKAFEAQVGLQRHDLLGGFVYEVLPAGLADAFDEDDLGEAGEVRETEVAFDATDGSPRRGTVTKTGFHGVDGAIAGLVVSLAGVE